MGNRHLVVVDTGHQLHHGHGKDDKLFPPDIQEHPHGGHPEKHSHGINVVRAGQPPQPHPRHIGPACQVDGHQKGRLQVLAPGFEHLNSADDQPKGAQDKVVPLVDQIEPDGREDVRQGHAVIGHINAAQHIEMLVHLRQQEGGGKQPQRGEGPPAQGMVENQRIQRHDSHRHHNDKPRLLAQKAKNHRAFIENPAQRLLPALAGQHLPQRQQKHRERHHQRRLSLADGENILKRRGGREVKQADQRGMLRPAAEASAQEKGGNHPRNDEHILGQIDQRRVVAEKLLCQDAHHVVHWDEPPYRNKPLVKHRARFKKFIQFRAVQIEIGHVGVQREHDDHIQQDQPDDGSLIQGIPGLPFPFRVKHSSSPIILVFGPFRQLPAREGCLPQGRFIIRQVFHSCQCPPPYGKAPAGCFPRGQQCVMRDVDLTPPRPPSAPGPRRNR